LAELAHSGNKKFQTPNPAGQKQPKEKKEEKSEQMRTSIQEHRSTSISAFALVHL
jgi:hypothetical protein